LNGAGGPNVLIHVNRRTTPTGDSEHRASLGIPEHGDHVVVDI